MGVPLSERVKAAWRSVDYGRRWLVGIIVSPVRRIWGIKLPAWVDGCADTFPILDVVALFIGWLALLIVAQTGQPWLRPVVWDGLWLTIIVVLGHWCVRYLRDIKGDRTSATRGLIFTVVVALAPACRMAWIVEIHNETPKAPIVGTTLAPSGPAATEESTGLNGQLTYRLNHGPSAAPEATILPTTPPMAVATAAPTTVNRQQTPSPTFSPLSPASSESGPIALKGSQIIVQPDGQPLDPQLKVRFINGATTPVSHVRVWIAPIYFDDLPRKQADEIRDLRQFDPEVLGRPILINEVSIGAGDTDPVGVDGFRPNHRLNGSGVQAIYVYYVYVDTSGVLHEPESSIFMFAPGIPGFTEFGLKDAFPDAWVRNALLSMGRKSVRYSDMLGEFGERR